RDGGRGRLARPRPPAAARRRPPRGRRRRGRLLGEDDDRPPTTPPLMGRYIIRRLLWGVATLILVLALLFVLCRVLPTADPAKLRAGRLQSPKIIAEIRHTYGLDKSLPAQFWLYVKELFLHFNLGFSFQSGAPVKELLFNRISATLSLVL